MPLDDELQMMPESPNIGRAFVILNNRVSTWKEGGPNTSDKANKKWAQQILLFSRQKQIKHLKLC